MHMRNKRRKISKRKIALFAIPLTIILLIIGLETSNTTNFFAKSNNKKVQNHQEEKAKTTSDAPSAQEDFSEGTERDPNTTQAQEGTVVDNKGDISSIPPQNQWTTSASGVLTIYTPSKNSVLSNGNSITGKTTASNISFRLIDDISGVIAQGNLPVVKGNFAGTFNFSTEGTSGRLDVFTTDSQGVESNNVEIPVRFK